ncbi:MAG: hypothetical protein K2W95_09820 [Candidatus Obscuribacterales bacterium]|nr:hypothetical protein [Candidatus Obscuribacterales bacterium]
MVRSINSTRVLIVDELRIVREHFADILNKTGLQSIALREASDSQSAQEQISVFRPDVTVLDPGSACANVMGLVAQVSVTSPDARILFWCSGRWQPVVRLLERSSPSHLSRSYILKSRTDEDLALALQCVVAKDCVYLDQTVRKVLSEGHLLTDIDQEILSYIAIGMTDKAIAIRSGTSSRTVQYRVAAAFGKILGVEGADENDYMLRNGFLNSRVRLVIESLRQSVLSLEHLEEAETSLRCWSAANLRGRKQQHSS